jgi:hypothetical protein
MNNTKTLRIPRKVFDNIIWFLPNFGFAQQVFMMAFKISCTKTRPVGKELIYVEQLIDRQTWCMYWVLFRDWRQHTDTCHVLSGTRVDFRRRESNICLFRQRKCHLKIWRSYTRFTLIPSGSPANTHPPGLIKFRNLLHTARVCYNTRYTILTRTRECQFQAIQTIHCYFYSFLIKSGVPGEEKYDSEENRFFFLFAKQYNTGIWIRTLIFHEEKSYFINHSELMAKESHALKGLLHSCNTQLNSIKFVFFSLDVLFFN